VVVSFDNPESEVTASLAGSPALLAEPAPIETGPVGQIARGMRLALESVAETDACLIWPGRMTWVDAETITSLIEAHGANREAILRPRYEGVVGWPALIPVTLLGWFGAQNPRQMPDEILSDMVAGGAAFLPVDTGDPGIAIDVTTALDDMPEFQAPPQPVAGHAPEWGAAAADTPDDLPLEGPALAPYPQAANEGD
jgi:CTP:molybdopterin cytidylyltransferase MocA